MLKSFKEALAGMEKRSAVILGYSVVAMVAYVYYGQPPFFRQTLGRLLDLGGLDEIAGRVYQFCFMTLVFAAVPAIIVKLVFKQNLRDYGVRLGDWKLGIPLALAAIVLVGPMVYGTGADPTFQAEYPLSKTAAETARRLVVYELLYLLYYIPWEFFFRGFMQFGLKDKYGAFGAIMFQTFASVLLHIGKPPAETWASVVAGPAFGIVSLKTGSILAVLIFHYLLGVGNDLSCLFHAGRLP